jgi:acetyl esterase/lipase
MMNYFKTTVLLALLATTLVGLHSCSTEPEENPTPPNTAQIATYDYGTHPLQNYRLYLPENYTSATELVIMIHGGGWVMGYHPDDTVSTFSGRYNWDILNPLLEKGYACAVMKYRTACYNTVPENFNNNTTFNQDRMMEDIDLLIAELVEKAGEMGFGADDIHLLGESAGGHIAMTYGIRRNASARVKSVASMFGPTDLDAQDFKSILGSLPLVNIPPPNYFLRKSADCKSVTNQEARVLFSMRSFADHSELKINEPNTYLAEISPSTAANIQNDIPLFIMHGERDELVPSTQLEVMYDAFKNVNGSTDCGAEAYNCDLKKKVYANCGHGWVGGNCARNEVMSDIVKWIEGH